MPINDEKSRWKDLWSTMGRQSQTHAMNVESFRPICTEMGAIATGINPGATDENKILPLWAKDSGQLRLLQEAVL